MSYNVQWAIEQFNSGKEMTFIPFWGHTMKPGKIRKQCFSQWFPCDFEVDGVHYHTSEQFMMSQKALLFGDQEVYEQIMAAADPADYKALGRKIHNFDGEIWDQHKFEIVVKGNIAKFGQNPELKEFLLGTVDAIPVEASPYDGIWGVKLGIDSPDIQNPNLWKGQNLLGFAIMEARDALCSSIIYEDDQVQIIGKWNSPYTGEIAGDTLHINVPLEYVDFLRKHNGGEFFENAENQHSVETGRLIFLNAQSVFNNTELRYLGKSWSDSNFGAVFDDQSSMGLYLDEVSSIFNYFYDTHLVFGYFEDKCDVWLLAIDRNGEYMLVCQSGHSDIEDIKIEEFKEPVRIQGKTCHRALYTPDGLLFPVFDEEKGTCYTIKPYSDFPGLLDAKEKSYYWMNNQDQRSLDLTEFWNICKECLL